MPIRGPETESLLRRLGHFGLSSGKKGKELLPRFSDQCVSSIGFIETVIPRTRLDNVR